MASAANLTPEDAEAAVALCACFNVRSTARAITRLYDDALEPAGLRSTQFVLLVSIQAHGHRGLPELATAMGVDRSALTRRLKPLERAGWAKVKPSRAAGPSRVQLTAKGARKVQQALPLWHDVQAGFVSAMSGDGWPQLLDGLRAARDAASSARS